MTVESRSDPLGVARTVARAIESVQGSYFVGGSLASSLQGEPRSTNDIDLVVAMRRPMVVRATGETLFVKSPEDTVLRKLLWHREGGGVSDRQWRDVTAVLRANVSTLDRGYLAAWAARLGLTDALDRAQRDAGR